MERIFKDPETLLPALAEFIVIQAEAAIRLRGRFSFVLSGGSSPKKLYQLLASAGWSEKIEWSRVFFFFGDERHVPLTHVDSNFRMVKESLFDPLMISDRQIFEFNTALSAEEGAAAYEKSVLDFFNGGPCAFDLVLLGLGDNSHTASLFPNTAVLHEKIRLVSGLMIEEVNMFRLTMTAPLINSAHIIAFLVYGSGKAKAVRHILKDPLNIEEYPAQLIRPLSGEVIWFLDEAASDLI